MKAWIVETLGQPARVVDQPVPVPERGQARIRIAACGLNFADLLMAKGQYQEHPALPYIPGWNLRAWSTRLGRIQVASPSAPASSPLPDLAG